MLSARMTLDQVAAQAVFRRLGFQREAVLWDYVITQDGRTRNLLVATKHL
jgi:RimJ/RimL family protein N-acetyltransferase